jgi:digeranylgeranylglycerophospholipid reductase
MPQVAVIGAGPAGLQTAIRLKELGVEVSVFEEHESIGVPEHCTGLISKRGVEELGLHLGDSLQNSIKGAKIFSPSGKMIKVKTKEVVAYVVNRKEFDSILLRKARLIGVHVSTETKLIDVRNNTLFIQNQKRGELRKADIIVGADGVNSTVRHLIGIKTNKDDFIHTIQTTCTGEFDPEMVEVHLLDYSKGFFAWVVPISKDKAKVGLGSTLGENISEALKKFISEKLKNARPYHYESALIPYGEPLKGIVKNNLVLIGDAAFQTKATTGGGVIFGMKSANILSQTIADTLNKKTTLNNYEKRMEELNKELKFHFKIRRYANSLTPKETDELFIKLKNKGIEEFLAKEGNMDEPTKFIGKLLTNPKYFLMLGTAMKFLTA